MRYHIEHDREKPKFKTKSFENDGGNESDGESDSDSGDDSMQSELERSWKHLVKEKTVQKRKVESEAARIHKVNNANRIP